MEREEIEQLKEIFVTRQECNIQMNSIDDKLSNDNARLAVIEAQLASIQKILYAIGAGIATLLIGSLWNLIAK